MTIRIPPQIGYMRDFSLFFSCTVFPGRLIHASCCTAALRYHNTEEL